MFKSLTSVVPGSCLLNRYFVLKVTTKLEVTGAAKEENRPHDCHRFSSLGLVQTRKSWEITRLAAVLAFGFKDTAAPTGLQEKVQASLSCAFQGRDNHACRQRGLCNDFKDGSLHTQHLNSGQYSLMAIPTNACATIPDLSYTSEDLD